MNTIEYFSGTGSFSKVAKSRGHTIFRFDIDSYFDTEMCGDILELNNEECYYNVAWFSPVCKGFSVAVIGRNWDKDTKQPKTESAIMSLKLLDKTISLISGGKYKYWFIENPRGMCRKVIDDIFEKYGIKHYIRHTVTYCQYGFDRMKPTDIWTNCKEWKSKPPCKNGDSCHISAPRGSRTGTQGIKDQRLRGVIPPLLFDEIFNSIENIEENERSKN